MTLPFLLPPTIPGNCEPIWTGNGFQIGDINTKVLEYSIDEKGWNDNLTFFHEESAGDHHFIDRASRNYAVSQLKKKLPDKTPVILEIGCSSGFMLQRLQTEFPLATIMGSDIVFAPLNKLAEKFSNLPLFRFDINQCPLPNESVDAVVMLNVLEHIADDTSALKQIYRILKPGGILILEVPAGPHLYDSYDKVLMHFRRYSLKNLTYLLKQKGFKIQKKSHLGFLLYPGFAYVKKKNVRYLNESDIVQKQMTEKQINATGNNIFFHLIMQLELFIGKLLSFPVGIRCVVSCAKST